MTGMVLMALGRMIWKLVKAFLWIAFQLLGFSLEIIKIGFLFTGMVLKLFLIILHAGS